MRVNWLVLSVLALCTFALQAAKISSLKIEGNTVIFTQNGTKTAASPACAASQPKSWGLQLLTDADRATYAALVGAAGSNMDIVVTSAQECLEGTATERVKSVEVLPVIAAALPQGMKIVATGYYFNTSGEQSIVNYTAISPSGQPYMITTVDYNNRRRLECKESHWFVTAVGDTRYVLCLTI